MQLLQAQVNTDLSWLQSFVHSPLALFILMFSVVIIFFIWKGMPFMKDLKWGIHKSLEKIEDEVKDIKEKVSGYEDALQNIMKDCLRMTIYQCDLSIPERLLASRRYFDIGGNGETKKYVQETLIPGNEELWESIQRFEFESKYFIK